MGRLIALLLLPFALVCSMAIMPSNGFARPPEKLGLQKTAAVVAAAQSLLNLLSQESQDQVLMPYESFPKAWPMYIRNVRPGHEDFFFVGEQYGKAVWSNFPISDVPRPGLRLGNMSVEEQTATMNLLRTALSDRGYSKVQDIMDADQALAESGTRYASGRSNYVLSIFGQPTMTDLWMIQFGGHHLGLNIAFRGPCAVLAPVLTGAQPASYMRNDTPQRVLANENDKAFALLQSMNEDQRNRTIIDHPVSDLVAGPGEDQTYVAASGIQASDMTSEQQDMLMGLIEEWVCILNDIHGASRLAEIRAALSHTYFTWSGPTVHDTDRNGRSYFRIQGPNLIIEFAPQFPGGDLTQHVHTIYRDHSGAYGRSLAGRVNPLLPEYTDSSGLPQQVLSL